MYLNYEDVVNTNYEQSRIVLSNFFDTLNSLPPERQILSVQFLAFVSVSEAFNGNLERADSLTKICVNRARKLQDENYFDVAYQNRGIYYWIIGNIDSARYFIEKAEKYALKTEDMDQLLAAKSNLSALVLNEGGYKEAANELKELMELFRQREKWQYMSDASSNLALCYAKQGQHYSAIKYCNLSIEILNNIGSKKNLLNPINNLATVYSTLGMDSLAVKYFKELISITTEIQNFNLYGLANINIARIHFKNNHFEEAKKTILLVLDYLESEDLPETSSYAWCYYYLGKIEIEQERTNVAVIHLMKATDIASEHQYLEQGVKANNALAELYLSSKKYELAEKHGKIALDSALKYNLLIDIKENSILLAKLYKELDNNMLAFKHYELFEESANTYLDTLTTQKTKDIAYFLEIKDKEKTAGVLQVEKELAEIQIAANNQKISKQRLIILFGVVILMLLLAGITIIIIILRQKAKLYNQLKEENEFKNNLFSIVSHDLRSPIASLYQMYMFLLVRKLDPEKRKKAELELTRKMEKTIDLVDNLLFWTKGQMKGEKTDPELINISDMLNDIIKHEIEERRKMGITFENLIDSSLNILTDKNIIHLVLRNLISNAYKFTPRGGRISISYQTKNGLSIFMVKDNGEGIKPIDQPKILENSKIISVKGVHGEQGKGLGLTLCKYFLQKIGGKLWFSSEYGAGTTFYFSVPEK